MTTHAYFYGTTAMIVGLESSERQSAKLAPVKMQKQGVAVDTPLTEERLAILGHEMRNPLSALSYALQVWPTEGDSLVTDRLLQIMRRQVLQLSQLSDDLLDTGRMARGELSIRQTPVDLGNLIRFACETIQPMIERYSHTLLVQINSRPITLLGDECKLIQVFANLLQNSTKFTPRNGKITVTLDEEDGAAIIRVSDNGRGISADALPEIFQGSAASRGSSLGHDGLGIGLRLVKAIVELHGGSVAGFSDGKGHGSTFVVTLPLHSGGAPGDSLVPVHAINSDRKSAEPLPPYRILVVDDDRSIGFLISRMLQKIHQTVSVADDGENVIEMIMKNRTDVVFMDLQLQGMSGFEVARRIRTHPELDHVVLIALSGNCDVASKELAKESGFDQYLTKPTSVETLKATLATVKPIQDRNVWKKS